MTHNKLNYLERFHARGYRLTAQRQAVLDAVCAAQGHTSIGDIYYRAKRLEPGMDRSTVYRTLDVLIELGLVIFADDIHGERLYELVKPHPHHHLVCRKCGQEIEIENQMIEAFYQQLQSAYAYQVDMDHLVVSGTCPDCSPDIP